MAESLSPFTLFPVRAKTARPPAGRTAAQMQTARENNERNNGALFKTCAPFTYCINEINNKHIDIAEDTDVVMPIIT